MMVAGSSGAFRREEHLQNILLYTPRLILVAGSSGVVVIELQL
jgi:hypothetical protein